MATIETRVDDLNPNVKTDVEFVQFQVYGREETFGIDLGKKNRERFQSAVTAAQGAYEQYVADAMKMYQDALSEFVDAATVMKSRKSTAEGGKVALTEVEKRRNAYIRQWAKDHNFSIQDRGAIPSTVKVAFYDAHKHLDGTEWEPQDLTAGQPFGPAQDTENAPE